MTLQQIMNKYGLSLYNQDGTLKNSIELLEDLYLKIKSHQIALLFNEIEEEEKYQDLFSKS